MPKPFVLVAELKVLPPRNIASLRSDIQNQFKNINADININVRNRSTINQINDSLKVTSNNVRGVTSGFATLSEQLAATGRRFGVFLVAAEALIKLKRATEEAIDSAIEYQRELVRLKQVGDDSNATIGDISNTITNLSKTLGVSSSELIKASVTLRQAGISAKETKILLDALAKTSLTPTFDTIEKTTEGLIALRQQFGLFGKDASKALGAINTVSAKYAVESDDLVTAIQKAGGAFKAAGGNFEEFLGIITSIRSTTRESADSISTGLRTIFARLQRPDTIEALKDIGINLQFTAEEAKKAGRDIEGQFVGPLEAAIRLQKQLANVPTGSPLFAGIVELIGGNRQVSKVIPLIQQAQKAREAYNLALQSGRSLDKDAGTAQEALATQVNKVKESFLDLIRTLGNNQALQGFLKLTLELTNQMLQLTKSVEPLIPLIIGLGLIKGAGTAYSVVNNLKGGAGSTRSLIPTPIPKKASGGIVGGTGDTDSEHLMVPEGSYILRKKAVKALGGYVNNLIGSDTSSSGKKTPILAMPGEAVIPPSQARKIGYSTLDRLNHFDSMSPQEKLAMKIRWMGGMSAMRPKGYGYAEGGSVIDMYAGGRKVRPINTRLNELLDKFARFEDKAPTANTYGLAPDPELQPRIYPNRVTESKSKVSQLRLSRAAIKAFFNEANTPIPDPTIQGGPGVFGGFRARRNARARLPLDESVPSFGITQFRKIFGRKPNVPVNEEISPESQLIGLLAPGETLYDKPKSYPVLRQPRGKEPFRLKLFGDTIYGPEQYDVNGNRITNNRINDKFYGRLGLNGQRRIYDLSKVGRFARGGSVFGSTNTNLNILQNYLDKRGAPGIIPKNVIRKLFVAPNIPTYGENLDGFFYPDTKSVVAKPKLSLVGHELAHAIDYSAGGNQFASDIKGTIFNRVGRAGSKLYSDQISGYNYDPSQYNREGTARAFEHFLRKKGVASHPKENSLFQLIKKELVPAFANATKQAPQSVIDRSNPDRPELASILNGIRGANPVKYAGGGRIYGNLPPSKRPYNLKQSLLDRLSQDKRFRGAENLLKEAQSTTAYKLFAETDASYLIGSGPFAAAVLAELGIKKGVSAIKKGANTFKNTGAMQTYQKLDPSVKSYTGVTPFAGAGILELIARRFGLLKGKMYGGMIPAYAQGGQAHELAKFAGTKDVKELERLLAGYPHPEEILYKSGARQGNYNPIAKVTDIEAAKAAIRHNLDVERGNAAPPTPIIINKRGYTGSFPYSKPNEPSNTVPPGVKNLGDLLGYIPDTGLNDPAALTAYLRAQGIQLPPNIKNKTSISGQASIKKTKSFSQYSQFPTFYNNILTADVSKHPEFISQVYESLYNRSYSNQIPEEKGSTESPVVVGQPKPPIIPVTSAFTALPPGLGIPARVQQQIAVTPSNNIQIPNNVISGTPITPPQLFNQPDTGQPSPIAQQIAYQAATGQGNLFPNGQTVFTPNQYAREAEYTAHAQEQQRNIDKLVPLGIEPQSLRGQGKQFLSQSNQLINNLQSQLAAAGTHLDPRKFISGIGINNQLGAGSNEFIGAYRSGVPGNLGNIKVRGGAGNDILLHEFGHAANDQLKNINAPNAYAASAIKGSAARQFAKIGSKLFLSRDERKAYLDYYRSQNPAATNAVIGNQLLDEGFAAAFSHVNQFQGGQLSRRQRRQLQNNPMFQQLLGLYNQSILPDLNNIGGYQPIVNGLPTNPGGTSDASLLFQNATDSTLPSEDDLLSVAGSKTKVPADIRQVLSDKDLSKIKRSQFINRNFPTFSRAFGNRINGSGQPSGFGIKFGSIKRGFNTFGNAAGNLGLLGVLGSQFAPQLLGDNKVGHVTEGALQLGGTGALLGAQVGGPIGAGIGALGGAVLGVVNSLKEFDKQLKQNNLNKELEKFSTSLSKLDLNSGASLSKSAANIRAGIAETNPTLSQDGLGILENFRAQGINLRRQFFGGDTGESIIGKERSEAQSQAIKQQLGQQLPALSEFGNKLAGSVKDIDSFKRGASGFGAELIGLIADIRGVSAREVSNEFKELISKLQDEKNQTTKLNHALSLISQQSSSFQRFSGAIEAASIKVSQFDHSLDAITASLGTIKPTDINQFSSGANLFGTSGTKEFNRSVDFVTNTVGTGSLKDNFAKFAKGSNRALQVIPAAISNLLSNPAEEKTLAPRFRENITTLAPDLDKDVIQHLTSIFAGITPQDFFKDAKADITKFSRDLAEKAFPNVIKVLDDSARLLEDRFNHLGGQLAKGQEIINRRIEAGSHFENVRLESSRNDALNLSRFAGRANNPIDFISLEQLNQPFNFRQRALTGFANDDANNPGAIANRFNQVQNQIESETQRRNTLTNPKDLEESQRKLVDLRGSAQRLQKALENLTNASEKSAGAQEKLAHLQEEQESRSNFVEQFIKSDIFGRTQLNRFAGTAQIAATSPAGLHALPTNLQGPTLSFIQSLGKSFLPNLNIHADDLAKNLIKNFAPGVIGNPAGNAEANQLREIISDNHKAAVDAASNLEKIIGTQQDKFFSELNRSQDTFLKELRSQLSDATKRDTDAQRATLTAKVGETQKPLAALQNLRKQGLIGTANDADDLTVLRNLAGSGAVKDFVNSQQKFESINPKDISKNLNVFGESASQIVSGVAGQARLAIGGSKEDQDFISDFINNRINEEFGKSKQGFTTRKALETALGGSQLGIAIPGFKESITNAVLGADPDREKFARGLSPEFFRNVTGEALSAQRLRANNELAINRGKALTETGATPEQLSKFTGNLKQNQTDAETLLKAKDAVITIGNAGDNLKPFIQEVNRATSALSQFSNPNVAGPPNLNAPLPVAKSKGGPVYLDGGGLAGGGPTGGKRPRFQPRGTDTIPAMLSPNEYIINAKSAIKYKSLLDDINRDTVYRAKGGYVSDELQRERRRRNPNLFGPNGEDLTIATGSADFDEEGRITHDNLLDRIYYQKNREQFITHAPEPGPLTDFERKEAANQTRARQFIQNQGQLDTQRQTNALGFLPERSQTTPQSFQDVIAQTRRNQAARRQDQNQRLNSQRVAANEFRTQFDRDEFIQIAPFIPERQRAAQARNLGLNPQTLQPVNGNTPGGLRSAALNGAISGAINGTVSNTNNPNNPNGNPFQQFAAEYKETTAAFGQNVTLMKKTIDEFNTSVKALTEKGINISIDRKGKIDVNINGVEVLAKIKGDMEAEIRNQIADAINKNNQDKDNNGG